MAKLAEEELKRGHRVALFGTGPEHFNVVSRTSTGVQHWRYALEVRDGVLGPTQDVRQLMGQKNGPEGVALALRHFGCKVGHHPDRSGKRDHPVAEGNCVFQGEGFDLFWKNTKPMRWANFLVFLLDKSKRKRSFHVAWNGTRFASNAEFDALEDREPGVLTALTEYLRGHARRYVKLPKKIDLDEDGQS